MAVLYQLWRRRSCSRGRHCRRLRQGVTHRSAAQTSCIRHLRCSPSMAHRLPCLPQPSSCRLVEPPPLSFPVTAGVPQGSILGPTLFLIYVNDAPEVLPRGVMPATYADDTTLFSLVANAVDAAEDCNALQAGTDALSTWGTTWRIQFEPTKSQAMTISRHRQPLPIAPLRFGGVAVEEVTTLRLLGVTFDNTMNFGQHLRSVTLRATQRIGFLRKASPVLDPPGRLTAYKGFVRPLMEYCPLVWNGAAPSHLARLDRVQKRALSLIGPGAVVDSLALRRTISGLCVLFKLMCGARLPCMAELLPPPADYANPRTRRQLQAAHGHCFQLKQTLPSRSHNTILQSFPNAHIPIWNSLPSSVIQEAPCLRSLQSFKSKSYNASTEERLALGYTSIPITLT